MRALSLHFEPQDLSEYWLPLVGVLLVVEWLRWVRRASPDQRVRRVIVGGAALGLTTAAALWSNLAWRPEAAPIALAALGVLALVWARRAYQSTTRPLSRRTRAALLSLRGMALVAILLFLARPVIMRTWMVEDRGTIAILVDNSRSMTIRDVPVAEGLRPRSRLGQLRDFLDAQSVTLDRIRRTKDVRCWSFDAALQPAELDAVKGTGEYTALAAALQAVRREVGGANGRLVGVVLLTDGGENFSAEDPLAVADAFGQASVPLWIIGFGSELPAGEIRSLSAQRFEVPPRVASLNRLHATGELLALGLAGTAVHTELLFDDAKVAEQTFEPTRPRELLTPDFSYVPAAAGLHKLTLRATAPALAPDRRTVTLSQFVHVTKDFLQVLYVDRPRYERASIARALEPAGELRLVKAHAGRIAGSVVNDVPRTAAEWSAFDAVILGDAPPGAFLDTQLEAMRDLVQRDGRGLLLIAGDRAMARGAFHGTPVADVLPVAADARGMLEGPVPVVPTAAGLVHPICQVADSPEELKRRWALVPAAPTADRLGEPKPAAAVLLATAGGEPLLVVQEVGAGRSAALALDSTWQWPLAADEGIEVHSRFWRQLVLWLANRRSSVWATTNQPRYRLPRLARATEMVVVEAGVVFFGQEGAPPHVVLTGELIGPEGRREALSFVRQGGAFEARPTVTRAGEYQIEVRATADDVALEPARTAMVVESPDIEMVEAMANFELLRRMAARTGAAGGAFATAEHADTVLERILAGQHTVRRRVSQSENLADRARRPLLLFIVGTIVVEWVWRKRCGLA